MGTSYAAILWKPYSRVRGELRRLDLENRRTNEGAELLALFVRNVTSQILNFGMIFPDEHDEGDFCDAADP